MKQPLDLEAFLNPTFFGLDTLSMLADVEDFIDFSESNIQWQKRRELRRADLECNDQQFDDPQVAHQYREHTIEGIEYRFDVSLTQRVRYAVLISFITTVEWVLISLRNRVSVQVSKKPSKKK